MFGSYHTLLTEKEMFIMKKIEVLPRTYTGNWASILGVAFIILFTAKMIMTEMPVPSYLIFATGLAGFILGIIAVFIKDDHAVFTYLSLLCGAFCMVWITAVYVYPY